MKKKTILIKIYLISQKTAHLSIQRRLNKLMKYKMKKTKTKEAWTKRIEKTSRYADNIYFHA